MLLPAASSFSHHQKRHISQDAHKGPTLFEQFKRIFREQMKKDEELQKNLKQFKESKGGEMLDKTGEKVKTTASKVKDTSKPIFDTVSSGLDKTSEKILQGTEKFAESKTVRKAQETVGKVKEQKLVKMVVDEWTREDKLRRQLHFIFRSEYGRKLDAERGVFWNPYTKKMEEYKEEEYDEETLEVTLASDHEDRKHQNRFSNIIKKLDNTLARADGSKPNALIYSSTNAAKKLFEKVGESRIARLPEEAEVMNAIKERDSSFDLDIFLGNLEHIVIPSLLESFLTDDVESLKKIVTPNCFQRYLYPHIRSRVHAKQRFNTKILNISEIDLYAAKFIGDHPTLIVYSVISYVHCITDLEGNIIEGGKSDIRKVNGHFALRQDPTENSMDWEIVESAFGMPERLAA